MLAVHDATTAVIPTPRATQQRQCRPVLGLQLARVTDIVGRKILTSVGQRRLDGRCARFVNSDVKENTMRGDRGC
jgi:hypothetical protein